MFGWKWNGIFFSKDEDGNGPGKTGEEKDTGKTDDDNQDNKESDKKEEEKKPKASFTDLLKDPEYQKAYEDSLKDRLRRDREARTEAEKKKAQEEAGEFKPLYEELKDKEEKEYKPALARLEAAEKTINEIIDEEITDWPDEVKEMDPGPTDVNARRNWLPKGRKLALKLKDSGNAPHGEHGRGKSGGGTGKVADDYVQSSYKRPELNR